MFYKMSQYNRNGMPEFLMPKLRIINDNRISRGINTRNKNYIGNKCLTLGYSRSPSPIIDPAHNNHYDQIEFYSYFLPFAQQRLNLWIISVTQKYFQNETPNYQLMKLEDYHHLLPVYADYPCIFTHYTTH